MEKIILQTITGDCDVKNVTMAEAVTNDGQKMLAVNDFFIGPKSHTSARTTDATVVFGTIGEGDPFRVLSKMPENGVIFSDGMEEDAIEFNSGVEVNIGMSEWKGCLVR